MGAERGKRLWMSLSGEDRLDIACWFFDQLVLHARRPYETYRNLIYSRLHLRGVRGAYRAIQESGGLMLHNAISGNECIMGIM